MPVSRFRIARIGVLAVLPLTLLAGCAKNKGELVVDDTVGVTALRSPCPLVEVPEMTGDVTLMLPGRDDAGAIDTVASLTNLRSTCDDAARAANLTTRVEYDVVARRSDVHGARHIDLPVFTVVERGGSTIVAKHLGTVGIDFTDGQARATAHGSAGAIVSRDEASLSAAIRAKLMRKRKPGDADASIDPLSLPDVKAALSKATFEVLVGFQMTDQQLAYNARR